MRKDVHVQMGSHDGKIVDLQNALKFDLIGGGAAGNHTVTGIAPADQILSVLHFTAGAALADLTSEFSISAADTINNTGGTDTTGDQLLVIWNDAT